MTVRFRKCIISVMLSVINSFISIILLISLVFPAAVTAEAPEIPLVPALLFSEIKVNHDTTVTGDIDEFIELYNPTTESVDLSRYEIRYFNNLTPSIEVPTKKIQPLSNGLLLPGQHIVLAEDQFHNTISDGAIVAELLTSGLRNDYGRLHLVETNTGVLIDTIAWASSASMAESYTIDNNLPVLTVCTSCANDKVKSLSRKTDDHQLYGLIDAVWQLASPTPGDFSLYTPPIQEDDEPVVPDVVTPPVTTPPTLTCEGVLLSEVLPNPAGLDTEGEFIEIYNPTEDVINLAGCSLQVSGSSKQFQLTGIIEPTEYRVFSPAESGLTLPNSAGGTVWLLSPAEELDSLTYPAGLEDDASWSFGDGVWQVSYVVTKGAANIIATVRPCPAGQVRNTETNRCQVPVVTAVASLTPCKAGQERNPETNRCRAVSAGNQLTECEEGQERNPETNRCRKVAAEGTALAAVTDVQVPTKSSSQKWWIAGVMLLAVIGYAVYEWRQDILLLSKSFLGKVGLKK